MSTPKPSKELLPELVFDSPYLCSRRVILYLTTASKDLSLEKNGTGDIDYRNTIAEYLSAEFLDAFYLIEKMNNEKEIFDLIEKTKATKNPILHIIINAPNTGCLFSIEALKAFKINGGRLVLTILEHEKHDDKLKKQTNEYIDLADHCIFLDHYDKKSAIESISSSIEAFCPSSILPVPATLDLQKYKTFLPFEKRGLDILIFCMFRNGAGYKPTIELAKLLKNSDDPKLREIQIWRVGSVFDKKENSVNKENSHNKEDDALLKLMLDIYPDKAAEIMNAGYARLKNLLALYDRMESKGQLERALPIKLVVDCNKKDLERIFNACQFAFSPKYNGADLRHSSTSTLLHHQFIVISHVGKKTPACLLKGGEYAKAMLLYEAKSREGQEPDQEQNVDIICKEYAAFAYRQIQERTKNPLLNKETQLAMQKLVSSTLDLNIIYDQLVVIYETVYKRKISELLPMVHFVRQKWLYFQQFKYGVYRRRAFKSFESKQKFDLEEIGKNLRKLINILKNKKDGFPPDMQALLMNKSSEAVLLPLEKKFLVSLCRNNKMRFKHRTNNLDKIKVNKNLMSADELQRRAVLGSYSNTPAGRGITDFVFASYGSFNPSSPLFIQHAEGQVVGNMDLIEENNPSLLRFAQISDHYAAYGSKYARQAVLLGSLLEMQYENRSKKMTYYSKNGEVLQTVHSGLGDDCFLFPHVDLGLYLMLILRLRYFGKEVWEKVINYILLGTRNSTLMMEDLINSFVHPGIFEFLIPCKFRVDQLGIEVYDAKSTSERQFSVNEVQWILIKICLENNSEVYMLSREKGSFPFFKLENSDVSVKTIANQLNNLTSLTISENSQVRLLFSGIKDCSVNSFENNVKGFIVQNVYCRDNFYLCELKLEEKDLAALKKNDKVLIVHRNQFFLSDPFCLNEKPKAINIGTLTLNPLTLYLLNLSSLPNYDPFLAVECFEQLYEKTYNVHELFLQTAFQEGQQNMQQKDFLFLDSSLGKDVFLNIWFEFPNNYEGRFCCIESLYHSFSSDRQSQLVDYIALNLERFNLDEVALLSFHIERACKYTWLIESRKRFNGGVDPLRFDGYIFKGYEHQKVSAFPLSNIKFIRSLLANGYKIPLQYFKKPESYEIILLANFNHQIDFTEYYKALNEKALENCYILACQYLSPHAKILYSFLTKVQRKKIFNILLSFEGAPLQAFNSFVYYIKAENNCFGSNPDSSIFSKTQKIANDLYNDLIHFALKNIEISDAELDHLCRIAAFYMEYGEKKYRDYTIADAIQNSIKRKDLIDAMTRQLCVYKADKTQDPQNIEESEDALKTLLKYWQSNGKDDAHFHSTLLTLFDNANNASQASNDSNAINASHASHASNVSSTLQSSTREASAIQVSAETRP